MIIIQGIARGCIPELRPIAGHAQGFLLRHISGSASKAFSGFLSNRSTTTSHNVPFQSFREEYRHKYPLGGDVNQMTEDRGQRTEDRGQNGFNPRPRVGHSRQAKNKSHWQKQKVDRVGIAHKKNCRTPCTLYEATSFQRSSYYYNPLSAGGRCPPYTKPVYLFAINRPQGRAPTFGLRVEPSLVLSMKITRLRLKCA